MNKKVKALARRSALSYKLQENSIIVVEDFTFESPKTKQYIEMLGKLNIADKKSLLVLPVADNNVYLSARNLQNTKVAIAKDINTYIVLNAGVMVVTEKSLTEIDGVLNK